MATDSPSSSSRSRSWSAPSSSHPPSRYITSNCGAGGRAAELGRGPRGAGSYTLRSGAWPVIVERSASSRTSRPRPPASTTPASPSTSSCSGVFSSATTAASPAAMTARGSPSPHSPTARRPHRRLQHRDDRSLDLAAPIEATTRSTPRCSAAPSSAASMSCSSPPDSAAARGGDVGDTAQNLRQDHPGVAARAVERAGRQGGRRLTTSADLASVLASASAERMVNSMLMPVSESATGNTLSRLISSMWVIRSPTAVCAQSRNADASSARFDPAAPTPPRSHLLAPPSVGASLSTRDDSADHVTPAVC